MFAHAPIRDKNRLLPAAGQTTAATNEATHDKTGPKACTAPDPVEGERYFRRTMFKIGAVLIAMHILFFASFLGAGAQVLSGLTTSLVEIKSALYYYDWTELGSISREIAASGSRSQALAVAKRYHLLDQNDQPFSLKRLTLRDGRSYDVRLVSVWDELPGSHHAGLTFMFCEPVALMEMDYTAAESWDSTWTKVWLESELLPLFPPDLARTIDRLSKPSSATALRASDDRLWLASVPELTKYEELDGLSSLGELVAAANTAHPARQLEWEGVAQSWWLRTSAEAGFAYVDEDGRVVLEGEGTDATIARGIVPFFTI